MSNEQLEKELAAAIQAQVTVIRKMVMASSEPKTASKITVQAPQPILNFDLETDAKLNAIEAEAFGGEMSEAELAKAFGESTKSFVPVVKKKKLKDMSQAEIMKASVDELRILVEEAEGDEREEDNSSDLYKIKARVANLARESGGVLTPAGEALCNSYVHVLKAFYDFADTLDFSTKMKLKEFIRRSEGFPGQVVGSQLAGVRG